MVLRLLVWGLILKNTPQLLPKVVQVSFMDYGCPPKMLIIKSCASSQRWSGLSRGWSWSTVVSTEIGFKVTYDSITDLGRSLEGFKLLSRLEANYPALELQPCHCLLRKSGALRCRQTKSHRSALSGRGVAIAMQVKERFEAEAEREINHDKNTNKNTYKLIKTVNIGCALSWR